MKLSAAVCNLCSYTVSDRWRGGGGGRQKYLAQFIQGNCVAGGIFFFLSNFSLFLTSLSKCITLLSMQLYSLLKQVFSYRYSAFGQTLPTARGPLHPEFPSVGCHSLYLKNQEITYHVDFYMLSQSVPKFAKKKLFRTYSTSFNHCLIVVEYAVQLLEAGVNVSHIVLGQNVTPAQTETVFHIHKTLIAALRQA